MTDTVNHKNIYAALAAAQTAMTAVTKGAINPAFKGEGRPKGTPYADLADVVSAVRPVLTANGICFFHQIIDGCTMRTSLVHGATETRIDCDVPLIVAKNDMQGMKSATTYAKRVGLESVTGVAPEDDDGNAAVKAAPANEAPVFDARVAADRVIAQLDSATTLADLGKMWKSEAQTISNINTLAPQIFLEIEAVKDARKDFFDTQIKAAHEPAPNADLDGDEIPY